MDKSLKFRSLWLKNGLVVTILTVVLMIVAGSSSHAAGAGQKKEKVRHDSSCALRIVYGGALRSSIEPCG